MEEVLIILYPGKAQGTSVMKYGRVAWCINWKVFTDSATPDQVRAEC